MEQPYLDYYIKNKISPITQKINNKKSFFMQRAFLYHTLGIGCSFQDRDILEFGPGNGVNAVYNNSLNPKSYTLVDGNPLAIGNIRRNLQEHFLNLNNIHLHHSLIEEFSHQPIYDVVICENVIPNLNNSADFLKMISQNVKEGGAVVITCNDAVSNLSETLRTLAAVGITSNINDLDEKANYLSQYFSPHLHSLRVVGRDFKDWVLDNVLNIQWSLSPLFSLDEAIQCLSSEFVFYNSSPCMVTDLRWYKTVNDVVSLQETNQIAAKNYYMNMANLLDYRIQVTPHSVEFGEEIHKIAKEIRALCARFIVNNNEQEFPLLVKYIKQLASIVRKVSPVTAASLMAYATMYEQKTFTTLHIAPELIDWWGRGTQYISLIKRNN